MLKIIKLLQRLKTAPGFTLVEVIISLTICFILVGGLSSVTRLVHQIFNTNEQMLTNQQNVYFAMEMMLRDLRAASSITDAQTQLVSFLDTAGNTVTYNLTEGTLQRSLTTSTGTTTEIMSTGITTLSFTYFNAEEQPPAEVTAVKRILITMQGTTATGSQLNLVNSVRPRNL